MKNIKFKYCPECQSEYEPEINLCTDCNVTLVNEQPLDIPLDQIEWVEAAQFSGKIYGEMAGEILDNHQIPYFLKSDFFASALNISQINIPGSIIKLYVPEDKKEQAAELINNLSQ